MRVSKLLLLNGPEPEPTRFVWRPAVWGAGNLASMAAAWDVILSIGIRLPTNGVRAPPLPTLGVPVAGSKICPLPTPPKSRYSLRSQNPVVFVAGLQDDLAKRGAC